MEALVAQTDYEVSEPVDATIGGYSGKQVDIIYPAEAFTPDTDQAPGCDESRYMIWSSAVYGPTPIYAQGADERWRTSILDADGTRLVIVAQDFPTTSDQGRAEMDAVIDSFVIEP